jgi:hypothetical protein
MKWVTDLLIFNGMPKKISDLSFALHALHCDKLTPSARNIGAI